MIQKCSPVVCLIVIIICVHVRHLLHIVSLALTRRGQSQMSPRDVEMSWFCISDVGLRRTVEESYTSSLDHDVMIAV